MKSFTATIRHWWRDLEARKLATMPPDQREAVLAFDRLMRRHQWRYTGAVLAVWLLGAVCFRAFAKDATWLESLVLMFLLLAVVGRDMMSVWFSHTKFKQMWRTAIWITGLTVAGALCGVMISRYRTVGSFDGVFDDPTGLGGRALLGGFLVGVIYSLALLVVSHVRWRTLQVRNEEPRRQVELPRLAEAVQRLRKRIDTKPPTAPPDLTLLVKSLLEQAKPTEKLRWIRASVGNASRLIHVNDVLFFQADTKYTRIVLKESEALVRMPLKELIEGLDTEIFWQVHRGSIVNAHVIDRAVREGPEKLTLYIKGSSARLAVSRQYFHLFKQT